MQKAKPLLIVVIAMGVLILLVTTVVVVKLVKDVVTAPAPVSVTLTTTMLHQPAGSRIVTITAVGGRLGVLLNGGGPDRILFVDPETGRVAGQMMLGQ